MRATALWSPGGATAVECYSALARLRRDEALNSADEAQARTVLHALMAVWTEIEPSVVVREQAGRVLLLHPLRAADAMQLAAAIVWANGQASGHEFVCLNHRLREAAQREGFTVLPKQLLS